MTDKVHAVLGAMGLVVLMLAGSACGSLFHTAEDLSGRVVDDSTGRPLAGVIVVAQWQPYYVGLAHAPGHRGVVHVQESVTDEEGRYIISGWGPKALPIGSEMRSADPALNFFKPGYIPFAAANTPVADPAARRTPPGVSEWHDKVVRLRKHYGPLGTYAQGLETLSRSLVDPVENWKSYPRIVYALWQEESRLPKGLIGPFSRLTPVDVPSLSAEDRRYLEAHGR